MLIKLKAKLSRFNTNIHTNIFRVDTHKTGHNSQTFYFRLMPGDILKSWKVSRSIIWALYGLIKLSQI